MTDLTKSELLVMKSIWEMGDGKTLPEITAYTNRRFLKDWKPQTVSTFLAKLVKKKFLSSKQAGIGRTHESQILIKESEYQKKQVKELFDFWGKEPMGQTLSAFFGEQGLEEASAKIVKDMIDDLDF